MNLFDVKRTVKVWNTGKVTDLLFSIHAQFTIEGYDSHGHAEFFFPEIHPHHLEAVDFRNQE